MREPLLDLELRRVVPAGAVVADWSARCRTAGTAAAAASARSLAPLKPVPGSRPRERIGHAAARGSRSSPDRATRLVDRYCAGMPLSSISPPSAATRRQIPAAAADVADLEQPLARQLALDADRCSATFCALLKSSGTNAARGSCPRNVFGAERGRRPARSTPIGIRVGQRGRGTSGRCRASATNGVDCEKPSWNDAGR